MADTANELAKVLSTVLGVPVTEGDKMVFKDCPAWDSMKHIEIIMAVEEKFNVSFAAEDIPNITSQAVLLNTIKSMQII